MENNKFDNKISPLAPIAIDDGKKKRLMSISHLQYNDVSQLQPWELAKQYYHAVRCGDTAMVQSSLQAKPSLLNELDNNLLGALHYAVRYDQIATLKLLVSLGANVNIRGKQGLRPLHIAALENNVEAMKLLLLARRVKVDAADEKGQTALHIATKRSHSEAVNLLLDHRANVMLRENDGVSVLHRPAQKDDKSVVDILLYRPDLIWGADNNGLTPVMAASGEGGLEVLKAFISKIQTRGANVRTILNKKDNDGNTSLYYAAQNGHYEVCQYLIENKADVNAARNDKNTPLHVAALMGKQDCVSLLLDNGAAINLTDSRRRTALHKAVITNQQQVVQLLLEKGADPDAEDDDFMTALHWAARKGNDAITKILLKNEPDLMNRDINMRTPLHWAVINESIPVINLLLQTAGEFLQEMVNASDTSSRTALHIAVEMDNEEITKLLLGKGALASAVDEADRNAAQIAAKLGHSKCLQALMSNADNKREALLHRDVGENTALLLAAENGQEHVFKILCDSGADFNAKDEQGKTALMMSVSNGKYNIAKVLLEKDVDVNATDKNKNTALHYASKGDKEGNCITLLLDYGSILTENFSKETPVDVAMFIQNDKALEIFFSEKNQDWTLSFRRDNGMTVFDTLIKHSPDTVKTLLDRSILETSEDPLDKNFSVLYNFGLIDPGPDDPASSEIRYFALRTMADEGNEDLLRHPVCKAILRYKWTGFVRYAFWFDLLFYLAFLACVTSFVVTQEPPHPDQIDATTGCKNQSVGGQYKTARQSLSDPTLIFQKSFITAFLAIQSLLQIFKLCYKRLEYFKNPETYFFLALYAVSWAFVVPPQSEPCLSNWVCAMFAAVLGWGVLIFQIEHLPVIGIYSLMFQKVLVSLIKVIVVFFFFIIGFAIAFYIGMRKQTPFSTVENSIMKTFDMTVGELDFVTYFISDSYGSFTEPLQGIVMVFIVMMPIALMNLLIGIAVGDIDGILSEAVISMLRIRITLLYEIETNLPTYFQRKLHRRYMEIYPNQDVGVCKVLCAGDYRKNYKKWISENNKNDKIESRASDFE